MGHFEKYTFTALFANARLNKKLANENEESRTFYCMSAIMFSAFTAEAFCNHIGAKHFKGWELVERGLSPKEKLELLGQHLGFSVDFSREPFQSFDSAIRLRNNLAHGKTERLEWKSGDDDPPKTKWEKECVLGNANRIFDQTKNLCTTIWVHVGEDGDDPFIIRSSGATWENA